LQRKDFEASQTVEILTAIESINVTWSAKPHLELRDLIFA
jgi:hypothetical protein